MTCSLRLTARCSDIYKSNLCGLDLARQKFERDTLFRMKPLFELPAGRRYDVVGFGSNAVDNIIVVDSYPKFNSKKEFLSHRRLAGGEAASTMVGLTWLGLRTAYAGSFGDDEDGKFGFSSLSEEGVDVSFSRIVENARTQSAFIIVDKNSGERTILWKRDASLNFPTEAVPVELAAEARVLHLTPHDLDAAVMMAEAARSAGTIVTIDIDSPTNSYELLLPLVDVCIVSDNFPRAAFGESDPRRGLKMIKEKFGCTIAGITLGSRGSMFLSDDGINESPAFAAPGGCKDTTGAGDAFRAGFIFGMLSGSGIAGCARSANAVAALKCRSIGARSALPTAKELSTLLKNY